MQLEVKNLFSLQLNEPELPENPLRCHILMFADIGVKGAPGADQFNFYAVTPPYLNHHPEVRWGHAYLLMPEFDWNELKRMLERLVAGVRADRWEDAANQLCRFLEWEFDGYQQ